MSQPPRQPSNPRKTPMSLGEFQGQGPSANSGGREVCRYFQKGTCQNGDKCRFAHIPATTGRFGAAAFAAQQTAGSSFVKGQRERGTVVNLKHTHGFIKVTAGDNANHSIFFSTSEVEGSQHLRDGDTVEFEVDLRAHSKTNAVEPCAVKVRLLGGLSFMQSAKNTRGQAHTLVPSDGSTSSSLSQSSTSSTHSTGSSNSSGSDSEQKSKPPALASLSPAWRVRHSQLSGNTVSAPPTPTGQTHLEKVKLYSPGQMVFVGPGGSITPSAAPTTVASHSPAKRALAPTWKGKQAPANPSPTARAASTPELAIHGSSVPRRRPHGATDKRDKGQVRGLKDTFGFICCSTAQHPNLFFHFREVERGVALKIGDFVDFIIRPDVKKPSERVASNVRLLHDDGTIGGEEEALQTVEASEDGFLESASGLDPSADLTLEAPANKGTKARFPTKASVTRWLELFTTKDPTNILLHRDDLDELLNKTELSFPIIAAITKILVHAEIRNHSGSEPIYKLVLESNFVKHPRNLNSFVLKLSNCTSPGAEEFDQVRDVLLLVEELLDRFAHAQAVLPLQILATGVEKMKGTYPGEVCRSILSLLEHSRAARQRTTQRMKEKTAELEDEDFHDIPVFPTAEEILNPDSRLESRLRKNIISGKYDSVMHYLDTHFRLLREDAITSIRDGIKSFRSSKDNSDVQVYTNVKMKGITTSSLGVMYRITFRLDVNVQWERTKRLMFGSLLCLSSDGFKTLLWATVASRDAALLATKKQVDIRFSEEFQALFDPHATYTMVESVSTYFEAYQHVLLALQKLQLENFPFLDYLIKCKPDVTPPPYLGGNDVYNMAGVFEGGPPSFPLLSEWPSDIETTMDESQQSALKQALTKEFAIIQGPPGTGKTYVGLKVMRAFLDNRSLRGRAPILVVCYTNHALDQFLEGVLKFEANIVRIGSRSKSEELKERNIKKLVIQSTRLGQAQWNERKTLVTKLKQLQEDLQSVFEDLSKAVLSRQDVETVVDDTAQAEALFEKVNNEEIGLAWELWLGVKPKEIVANQQKILAAASKKAAGGGASAAATAEGLALLGEFANVGRASSLEDSDEEDPDMVIQTQNERMVGEDEEQKFQSLELEETLLDVSAVIPEALKEVTNVWKISKPERALLYLYWLSKYRKTQVKDVLSHLCEEYETHAAQKNAIESQLQLQVLSEAAVIGMTTTGVAKFQTLIQQTRPEVIIVEEAAEVLEAHILTALSSATKHLVLIGDHEQLRPSTAVYRLATKYHLDVSLFERMVKNGLEHRTLLRQRRMRPEISSLIKPIYPELYNHPDVEKYPAVKGVSTNLFFLDHEVLESSDGESGLSKSNKHESAFIARLCQHLLLQGYTPKQITVLTAYAGQVKQIRADNRNLNIDKVYVTSVDNYQGEENDIILLSLVRSNKQGTIGFLSTSNRICVALSRAKVGLYIVGNASLLAGKNPTWSNVCSILKASNSLGKTLTLQCQKHPNKRATVAKDSDFKQVEDGGCDKPCGETLDCGHKCPRLCHPYAHSEVLCGQPCEKIHPDCKHKCVRRCFEPCGDCEVSVRFTFADCKHTHIFPCFEFGEDVKCPSPCERTLPCGHRCGLPCGFKCNAACRHLVERKLPCTHTTQAECSADANKIKCTVIGCVGVPVAAK